MNQRITQITLVEDGEPIFSEEGFTISIEDEAGGEFVVVRCQMPGYDKIAINQNEWPEVRDAIDSMVKECRS